MKIDGLRFEGIEKVSMQHEAQDNAVLEISRKIK